MRARASPQPAAEAPGAETGEGEPASPDGVTAQGCVLSPPRAHNPATHAPRGRCRRDDDGEEALPAEPQSPEAAAVQAMNLRELRAAYNAAFGFRTGSKNLAWMRNKLLERCAGGGGAAASLSAAQARRARAQASQAAVAAEAAAVDMPRPRRAAGAPQRYIAETEEDAERALHESLGAGAAAAAATRPPQSRVSGHFAARRASGGRAGAKASGGGGRAVPARCVSLPRITLGELSLSVGDSVFVLTAAGLRVERTCAACGRGDGGPTGAMPADAAPAPPVLLECGRCLRGVHLSCAGLPAVPAGEWACAACAAMPKLPAPPTDIARLDAGLLYLARIDAIWWDERTRDYFFRARWYHTPPARGATRWWARGAALREVCLGTRADADAAPVSSVVRRAEVLSPAAARAAAKRPQPKGPRGQPPPLPLVCHRSYDPATRAFMPLQL